MRNFLDKVSITSSLAVAAYDTVQLEEGTSVDLSNYGAASVVFFPGTVTDGVFEAQVLESDDDSTFTEVDASNLSAALGNLASDTLQKVDYKGSKRYIKAAVDVTDGNNDLADGAVFGAVIIRSRPAKV